MAVDITKSSCKYYTYNARSESNCLNVSWTFLNYSKLPIDKEFVISPELPMPECHLELIFKKASYDLSLFVTYEGSRELKSDIIVRMCDENRKMLQTIEKKEIVLRRYNRIDVCPQILSSLYDSMNSLQNDTLTFDLEFEIEDTVTWDTFEEHNLSHYKNETKFSEDLKTFILENHPKNVVLKTKDLQILVNKAILQTRSPVFRKMFEHSMIEQENDFVLIDDVSGSTLQILVDFITTGKADLKVELSRIGELYYASDKYDVQDIRKTCAAIILHGLTTENVFNVLKLASKHSDEHLKKGCMIFIRRNIVSVMKTDVWKDLKTSDPDLCFKIFEFYVGDANAE